MKIKHNLKILEDWVTIQGQILETIFESGEKRGDWKDCLSEDEKYRLSSRIFPQLKGHFLCVYWADKNTDNEIISYKYDTPEEAQKVLDYINEFTIQEEVFEEWERVLVSLDWEDWEDDIFLMKNKSWYIICMGDYFNVNFIHNRITEVIYRKYIKKLPKTKQITIEVTEEQEKEINKLLNK